MEEDKQELTFRPQDVSKAFQVRLRRHKDAEKTNHGASLKCQRLATARVSKDVGQSQSWGGRQRCSQESHQVLSVLLISCHVSRIWKQRHGHSKFASLLPLFSQPMNSNVHPSSALMSPQSGFIFFFKLPWVIPGDSCR